MFRAQAMSDEPRSKTIRDPEMDFRGFVALYILVFWLSRQELAFKVILNRIKAQWLWEECEYFKKKMKDIEFEDIEYFYF